MRGKIAKINNYCRFLQKKPLIATSVLLLKFMIHYSTFAQVADTTQGYHEENKLTIISHAVINNFDTLRAAKLDMGKAKFTPYIVPAYNPEIQLYVSLGGLLSFKTQRRNPILSRSSITFSGEFSIIGAINSSIRANIFGPENRFKSTFDFWLKSGPDNYWGVGYDNAYNYSKSDSATEYNRIWMQCAGKFVYNVYEDLYIGMNYDFNYIEATNLNPRMLQDPYIAAYGTTIKNGGLGLSIDWDSRDYSLNAYKGILISVNSTFYNKIFGGSDNYQSYMLDIRKYLTILRERQTLSFEVKTKTLIGDVSWNDMAIVGSPFDLRGYYWGRYRDKTMAFGLMEYRYMFKKQRLNKKGNYNSRHGFVIWGGLGSIGPKYEDFEHIIPNAGFGYRFEIQNRMNLRIDLGFGKKTNALYVTFQEAF